MIKDNQQHFNRLHVIIDAFVIVVSYILAWWLKFSSYHKNNNTIIFQKAQLLFLKTLVTIS